MSLDISLPDDLEALVQAKLKTGRYRSSGDVLREALDLLDRRDRAETVSRLREAWRDGVASGPAGDLDFEALKQEARDRLAPAPGMR